MTGNILFDYDGTLHDCLKIYAPAFRQAYSRLVQDGYVPERTFEDKEISRWLGFTAKEMWDSFAPDLPREQKELCSQLIGKEMLRLTEYGHARLYPGTIETLALLKKQGYTLLFLSNCKHSYMLAHISFFHLDDYFDDFFCAEDFNWIPKTEIFPHIAESYPGDFTIVGDRFHDMEIARLHHLRSIGCSYGYGHSDELACADFIIPTIQDIGTVLLSD